MKVMDSTAKAELGAATQETEANLPLWERTLREIQRVIPEAYRSLYDPNVPPKREDVESPEEIERPVSSNDGALITFKRTNYYGTDTHPIDYPYSKIELIYEPGEPSNIAREDLTVTTPIPGDIPEGSVRMTRLKTTGGYFRADSRSKRLEPAKKNFLKTIGNVSKVLRSPSAMSPRPRGK